MVVDAPQQQISVKSNQRCIMQAVRNCQGYFDQSPFSVPGNTQFFRPAFWRFCGSCGFFLGKSFPESCPLGPYLVTKDEIPQSQDLSIVTKVNEEVRQNGNTKQMLRRVDELIAEISKYVELEAGDVILTGTPAGVGKGFNPPKFLKAGDTVKVSIESIGTLVTHFS